VATLGTVLSVLLTGAFHEDGLADVADGLGGTMERHRALEIMKDSRVGAFGAIAVALVLLIKVSVLATLGALSPLVLCGALFAGHVVSRTWPLLTIRLLVHVGDVAGSKSKPLADQISGASLLVGSLWCLAGVLVGLMVATHPVSSQRIEAALVPLALCLLSGVALNGIAWAWMTRWFRRRLQGFTGDCLGAIQQVGEVAFYLGLVLAWPLIVQSIAL
jgi:adenosylcobinamide-GDP ribazoletransferase